MFVVAAAVFAIVVVWKVLIRPKNSLQIIIGDEIGHFGKMVNGSKVMSQDCGEIGRNMK